MTSEIPESNFNKDVFDVREYAHFGNAISAEEHICRIRFDATS